ncbi:MAG: hypothetical protein ACPLZF_05025 [Nitrososphaeria archaeon]
MKGCSKILLFVIAGMACLVVCYSAYLETLKSLPLQKITSGYSTSAISSEFNFQLYPPDKVIIPRVDYYIVLANGTQIYFGAKNPLKFEIKVASDIKLDVPKELTVFKVNVLNDVDDVLDLASKVGYMTDKIYYDNDTETYVVHNSTHCFEYSRGYFRLWKIDRNELVKGFPPDNLLIERAKNFLYERSLLPEGNYQCTVGAFKTVDGEPVLKHVSFAININGLQVEGLGFSIIFNAEGEIVEVEGFTMSKIEALKTYPTKTVEEVVGELKEKISTGAPRWDWRIDIIAFTTMNITGIKLKYYRTIEGYIVPIYEIEGTSSLDIDGTNYMKRENSARLIAVKRV